MRHGSRAVRDAAWLAASLASLAVVAPAPGQAPAMPDSAIYVLEELVITAERERSAPPPVATLRVEAVEVHRAQSANPYDLVRRVAGLEVHEQGQGPGFASNAVIRGFTSDHSSDVLLVVDGVPVNLPIHGHVEGYADWNGLIPATVSSMRVIHGAASPLYGDFALGGVAEVFTAADADGTEASVLGSSFGDVGGWLRTGVRRAGGGALAAVEARRMEGWRRNSDYTLTNALLRGWRATGEGRVEGGLSLYRSTWSSPGFLTVPQYNDGPLTLAADPTDGGAVTRVVAHGRYALPLSADVFLQATGWGLVSDWELALNIPGHGDGLALSQTTDTDDRVGAGAQVELAWMAGENELTLGASGRADRAAYTNGATEARALLQREVDVRARHASGALFGRWRRTFADRLGVDLGLRADLLHHRAEDRLAATAGAEESIRTVVSPKAGVRYQASDRLAFRASSSRGFRSAPGVVGDADRPPMLAWAHEVAAEVDLGRFGGSLALFRMDVSNERTMDPVTRVISSTGGSVRQGVDVEGRVALSPSLTVHAAGTWNDARLRGHYADAHDDHGHAHSLAPSFSRASTGLRPTAPLFHEGADHLELGDRVPGVSLYTGRVGVDARLRDQYDLRAAWRFTGPYVPIGEPAVETMAYSVLDLGASLPVGERLVIDAELQNVLGIRYAELRASGFVNPGAPRTLRASLRYRPGVD